MSHHEPRFDEDDPWLARIRRLALDLPDADEKVSHGIPAFFTTRVFAYYGSSQKVDGVWVRHPHSLVVQPAEEDRAGLAADDRVVVPAYLGPSGWLAVLLDDRTDDAELAELLEDSYRRTAGVRRVARLEAQRGGRPT